MNPLDESEAYWGWLLQELGFTPFQHWEEGRSWRHGDFYLVIVQTEERFQDVPYHRCRTGLNHLAFRVPTKADVDRLTQEVKKEGCRSCTRTGIRLQADRITMRFTRRTQTG